MTFPDNLEQFEIGNDPGPIDFEASGLWLQLSHAEEVLKFYSDLEWFRQIDGVECTQLHLMYEGPGKAKAYFEMWSNK